MTGSAFTPTIDPMGSESDVKIVDEVLGRLSTKFPGLSADFLAKRVWATLQSFMNPSIRDFLPVLVERRVVEELRAATL